MLSFIRAIKSYLLLLIREKIIQLGLIIIGFALLGSGIVFLVEAGQPHTFYKNFFDAFWWAIVTITGVGYGDLYPVTTLSRIFACFLMFGGITLTSLLSGTVASIIVERKLKEDKGLETINAKRHIIICGWNKQIDHLLAELSQLYGELNEGIVLVNEMSSEEISMLRARFPGLKLRYVRGDFVSELILKKASAVSARTAIIMADASKGSMLPNADEKTVLAALTLKSLNPNLIISAELIEAKNEQHLKRAGVDNIIVYGEYNSYLLAASTKAVGFTKAVRQLLSSLGGNKLDVVEIPNQFIGRTFAELATYFLSSDKGILIGLRSQEKKIELKDILADDSSAIDAFIKRKFAEAEIDLNQEQGEEIQIRLNPGKGYIIKESDSALVISQA